MKYSKTTFQPYILKQDANHTTNYLAKQGNIKYAKKEWTIPKINKYTSVKYTHMKLAKL